MDDHRIAEAKGMDLLEVANLLQIQGLKRAGVEHIGPCPIHFGKETFVAKVTLQCC